MKETYHAFILTKDRKLFEGAAEKQNATDWVVGLNRTIHPTIDENKLLMDMHDVLVDFTKRYK